MYSLGNFYVYVINYPYVVHFDYRHFCQLHLNKLKNGTFSLPIKMY